MRVNNSSPSIYHINQRNNLTNNKELFKSTLFVQTVEKKEDEEKKDKSVEKKGQLVTAREGAYTRQYLVNSDGSKVLLSDSNSNKNQNDDGMSNNSKEIVSLLNQQIGNFNQPKTTN
ncbi:hypothetical protein BS614_08705 [Paenibacillus xylanexedens]|uniref:hypothetical protein n=1 Tax=Paenibacillus xylanexedens TaxID=528191 RepID=UPI0009381851|nr:hypothetical protein [Paenibacillus xylanexedens]APO44078.1 hypothetical protein BS614_08705 [Paenibacillus xylanexedens]